MGTAKTVSALAVLAMLAGLPAAAVADPPPDPQLLDVTDDMTLSEDWYGSIRVVAPDVTFDCAGHRIVGPGYDTGEEEFGGITVEPSSPEGELVENVTIRNCVVVNHVGGVAVGADGTTLVNNTVDASGGLGGFSIFSNDNIIRDNLATDAGFDGFLVRGSPPEEFGEPVTGNILQSNRAENNVSNFSLEYADHNTLIGNVARGTTVFGNGFQIAYASFNDLQGNTATGVETGFGLIGSSFGNTLRGNTGVANSFAGFVIESESMGNSLDGNHATGNGDNGFAVWGPDNHLLKNVATDNHAHGFEIGEIWGTNLVQNRSHRNGFTGFLILGDSTLLSKNSACGNNQVGEPGVADYTITEDAIETVTLDRNSFCSSAVEPG